MNKDELKNWFWEKFNSCYLVKHDDYPESIFMFYDPQFVRKLKLANISGEKINKTNITGVCLFEQNWRDNKFFYDFHEIWEYIRNNYIGEVSDIKLFVREMLVDHPKMSVLTTHSRNSSSHTWLVDHPKMSVLTTMCTMCNLKSRLDESKLSLLTSTATIF